MMRGVISKIPLIIFLTLTVIPIASILYLSFSNLDGDNFKWYRTILGDENFTRSLGISIFISFFVGISSALFAFVISLTWFHKNQFIIGFIMVLVLGLMPPDIIALSISQLSQILGIHRLNIAFLIFALTLYCIPFGILLIWSRYFFLDDTLLISARDLGMKKLSIIFKVIFPIVLPAIAACFLLSFLLAFNEYPRTYYLSGAHQLVSEYLYGKLSAGTDESIYAGGSLTVIITSVIVIGAFSPNWLRSRKLPKNKFS